MRAAVVQPALLAVFMLFGACANAASGGPFDGSISSTNLSSTEWYAVSGNVTGKTAWGDGKDNPYALIKPQGDSFGILDQVFQGLVANQDYVVTFRTSGSGYSSLSYGIETTDYATLTGAQDTDPTGTVFGINSEAWVTRSYTFNSGTSNSWTMWFKSDATIGLSIDSVSLSQVPVSAIPEPESFAMMVAGLAALGFMSRRRKTS